MDISSGPDRRSAQGSGSPLLKNKPSRRSTDAGLDGIRIAREEARHMDTRDHDRHSVQERSCRLSYRGCDHEAEIVNVSGGGAMLSTGLRPNLTDRLDLNLGEHGRVECIVRWVKGDRIGVEFAHETRLDCSDEDRAALLLEVIERGVEGAESIEPAAGSDSPDQRVAKRHPLIWSGELRSGLESWRVRLRNVSATGALVQCSSPLPVDRDVTLELGKGGSVKATVSWAVGDHAGLRFDEPFDMRRLSHSKPEVTAPKWVRPAYLADDTSPDSPWDQSWSRMSVEQMKTELEGFLKR